MADVSLTIKKKQFIVTGYSSDLANLALAKFSKYNEIFGTYNSNKIDVNEKNIFLHKLDLSNEESIKKYVDEIKNKLSKIIIINFAAYKNDNLILNYKKSDLKNAFNINVFSNFLLTKYLTPIMINNKWGRIIHISSEKALRGTVGSSIYSSSKAALIGLNRGIAKEYARFGITSNIINLGYFDSGLYRKLPDKTKREFINSSPTKKLGSPSNIYNCISFLIESDFTNGSIITIDGCMD